MRVEDMFIREYKKFYSTKIAGILFGLYQSYGLPIDIGLDHLIETGHFKKCLIGEATKERKRIAMEKYLEEGVMTEDYVRYYIK